jgi:wyosine [tRNA(Phe)-imidazoG37] synthetase (radical SAM superfamily)
MAANIGEAIRAVSSLRKEPIAVLTNGSLMRDSRLRDELVLADLVAVKLDASSGELLEKINRPAKNIEFRDIVAGIKEFRRYCRGELALQMMFLADNIDRVDEMISLAEGIRADEIQINTPLRPCEKAPLTREDILRIKAAFLHARERGRLNPGTKIVSVYDEMSPKDVLSISDNDTLKRRGKVKP